MDSPCESESSDGGAMLPPSSSPGSRDQLQKRIDSLMQQNRVYKVELETYKIRVKVLQEENKALRQASVIIQAKAEQEEEYISNTLLKKIQALKKEKETLAHQYEREEECLTNELSRKLDQLRQEKCKLEQTLEQEQECLVNKLMRKIEKLEADTLSKQTNLEQLRREKIELENTLEQEQEALVNKLWKRMDKLEQEKRSLQIKLDQPVSDTTSNSKFESDILATLNGSSTDTASNLSNHIRTLRSEIVRLRANLENAQKATQQFVADEKSIREENMRLQMRLQMEVERREALCRHLSESESSLEMEEERLYHESLNNSVSSLNSSHRQRTISSPVPHSPSSSRPISPGSASFSGRCCTCGQILGGGGGAGGAGGRRTSGFIKPAIPLMVGGGGGGVGQGGGGNGAPPAFGVASSVVVGGGFMSGSNRNSMDSGSGVAGGGGAFSSNTSGSSSGGFSPNHSNQGGNNATNSANNNSGAAAASGAGLMHTFLQPASPMDTSVYKE